QGDLGCLGCSPRLADRAPDLVENPKSRCSAGLKALFKADYLYARDEFEMLGLVSVIITSGTALWIAYNVYPIQKKRDRELKLQEEKAAVYRDFLTAANDYYEGLKKSFRDKVVDALDAEYQALLKAQAALTLYAPPKVVAECKSCTAAFFEYRHHLRVERGIGALKQDLTAKNRGHAYHLAETTRNKALVTMRTDIWGCSEQEACNAVAGIYPKDDAMGQQP
ncbi:MAG: hypothetical protein ACK5LJ_03020, partial [Paracoccus sp. (in: a-proteobacteria)]